jgi:uncharacterized protein (UPF0332 family)
MNMEVGDKLIDRTKQKLLSVVGEDLFYAVMNPTQAALMLYGIPPPTPKEAVKLMEEIYVKKEKMLEQKYIQILENIRKTFKEIEHGELKEVSGKDIDKLLKDCKDYLERIKQLFNEIQDRNDQAAVSEIYTTVLNLSRDLLLEHNIKDIAPAKIPELFEKNLCGKEKLPIKYHTALLDVIKAKKDFDAKKLTKQEINKVKRESRELIRILIDVLDQKRSFKIEKAKLHFKYGEAKVGELIFLKEVVFLIKDVTKRDEIWIGTLDADGSVLNLKRSDATEYEKYINNAKMPEEKVLKNKTLESLKKIIGEDVDILWKA